MGERKGMSLRGGYLLGAAIVVCLGGLGVWAETAEETIIIKGVPHIQQEPDFCGEACIAMWLQKLGHNVTQDDVFNLAGVDPVLGRGCITGDMDRVLKRIGFKPGDVRHKIDPRKSESQLEAQWKILLADLRTGVASIVCMRYDNRSGASEHFRLVLGYDGKKDEVIYHEPAEKNDAYRRMKREKFIELWPLKYKKDQWLAIRMSLRMCVRSGTAILAVRFTRESSSWEKDQLQGQDDPATHGQAPRAPCGDAHATIERLLPPAIRGGKTTIAKSGGGFTDADYAQHIMKLKPTVPEGFTIVLQRPFVVVGDEPASVVGYRADRTVKWFVDRIGKLYFKKDPPKIYDIWLFKDDKSYRKNAEELFGDRPDTPFGYCSDAHGALVMNIATGGGTLCHEIVHAYIASNFPDCPAWFNEGLASLYEQCGTREDTVVGLTNWRLEGLKKEIQADNLPSFETLLSTTTYQFYNMAKGNNYAQARYLCYYLQEKDLLVNFYNAFVRNAKDDPSGYGTLKKILNEADMDEFKDRWEKWVLKLTFG